MTSPEDNSVGPETGGPPAAVADKPCPTNRTMFQGFEWYCPPDHKHWSRLARAAPGLATLGVTSMWIPPATKAAGEKSNGYDVYDLYDLGEFRQKGPGHTKWGTKTELVALADVSRAHGIDIIFDTVLNHKAGADYTERVKAVRVDPKDRTASAGKTETIEVWTGFSFKGRGAAYSSMKWNHNHFTGADYCHRTKTKAVWRFEGKEWAHDVDEELGNYDYLMFADIDHADPEVRRDLARWVAWLPSQLKLGGLRLDAIKHYSAEFLRALIAHIDQTVGRDWFIVGEYWRVDTGVLAKYIEYMQHRISLFDVQLLFNFSRLSAQEGGDLRTVFDDTLVHHKPQNAVTFVVNHDTQEGQSLETPVDPYFIPMAYALILLRPSGLPCVFYGDLYGTLGPGPRRSGGRGPAFAPPTSGGLVLPRLMLARKLYAYGTQTDYFDQPGCVGFTRQGHPSRSGGAGLAVLLTNGWEFATKRMHVGGQHAGERWTDVLKGCWGEVVIDAEGWGLFAVGPRSVAVWADRSAEERAQLDHLVFDADIYGLESPDAALGVMLEPRKLQTVPPWLRAAGSEQGSAKR